MCTQLTKKNHDKPVTGRVKKFHQLDRKNFRTRPGKRFATPCRRTGYALQSSRARGPADHFHFAVVSFSGAILRKRGVDGATVPFQFHRRVHN